MDPTAPVESQTLPKPKSKAPLLLTIWGVLLALVAGVVVFNYTQKPSSKAIAESASVPSPIPTTAPTQVTSPNHDPTTADWIQYSGDGFSFKYPSNYKLIKHTDSEHIWTTSSAGNSEIVMFLRWNQNFQDISVNSEILLPLKFENGEVTDTIINVGEINKKSKIMLDSKEADFYEINPPGPDSIYQLVRFKTNETKSGRYELGATIAGGGLESTFQKILSTFKFL